MFETLCEGDILNVWVNSLLVALIELLLKNETRDRPNIIFEKKESDREKETLQRSYDI